jgi:hypothetical protein
MNVSKVQVPVSEGVVKKIRGLRWTVSTFQGEERANGRSCGYAFLSKYLVRGFEMGRDTGPLGEPSPRPLISKFRPKGERQRN